jgi:N-dimethylarginine dimethylaminohydrolase
MLMCEPVHFEIAYEINPWMKGQSIDRDVAWSQWRGLRDRLVELGVTIDLIPPVPGLPDMVFTGDGGAAIDDLFLKSNFLPPERAAEAEHFAAWFATHGYAIAAPPTGMNFEGLGDLVIQGRQAVVAYGQRSTPEVVGFLRSELPQLDFVAEVELVDPRFFHLGIALSLLDEHTGLWVPEAFAPDDRPVVERLRETMIAVSDEDAERLAVNAIVVGRDLVVHGCTPSLEAELGAHGFRVHVSDVGEFVKSGGGTRCLVLPRYRISTQATVL